MSQDLVAEQAAAIAIAQDVAARAELTFWAVTTEVAAPDGTVSILSGRRGYESSVRAAKSYTPRNVGDDVLVAVTAAGPVVILAVGPAQPIVTALPPFTLSPAAAPPGYDAVSAVAAKQDRSLWLQQTTAPPPSTAGTVTVAFSTFTTYRGGTTSQQGKAETGDYTGRGLQTGLATASSTAWSGLSGKTPTGGVLTVHRSGAGHGFTYGKVPITAWRAVASSPPPPAPPALIAGNVLLAAALNETVSVAVGAAWCQAYTNGSATAVAFYSGNPRDNVEIDACTLTINHS